MTAILVCLFPPPLSKVELVTSLMHMAPFSVLDPRQAAFLTLDDLLSSDKDRRVYEMRLDRGGRYTFSGANFDPGENIRLILKDADGRVLAESDGANGAEDPVVNYRASRTGSVRLIVKAEDDFDNSGEIPFSLSVRNQGLDVVPSRSGDVDLPSLDALGFDVVLERLSERLFEDGVTLSDLDLLLASTTADGSRVSESELDALATVARTLHKFVDDPILSDYYSYVFSAAVGVNPANRYWTGGVQDRNNRIDLGNLEVGSNRKQVEYLRRKWFRGEDLPLARIDGDSAANRSPFEFSYATATGAVFDGDIDFDQVAQGAAGTCYFLAALMSVSRTNPDLIRGMFVDNQDGTYGVRFFGLNGSDAWVTVNRDLPIGGDSLLLAGSYRDFKGVKSPETNELWAALAEKALAQVNETGVLRRAMSENSYQAIEAGNGESLDYITGRRSSLAYPGFVEEIGFNGVRDAVVGGRAVYLASGSDWSSSPGVEQLVEGHAYSVIDYDGSVDTFVIANPWGSESTGSFDPVFGISSNDLYGLYSSGLVNFAVV